MQEYEYKVAFYKRFKSVEREMNKMAEDGWKVFSTHLVADGTQMVVVYERKYRV